jgi:hypothetical protein
MQKKRQMKQHSETHTVPTLEDCLHQHLALHQQNSCWLREWLLLQRCVTLHARGALAFMEGDTQRAFFRFLRLAGKFVRLVVPPAGAVGLTQQQCTIIIAAPRTIRVRLDQAPPLAF